MPRRKIIDVDSDIYKYGFESILSSYLCIAIVLFTGIFIKYKLIAFFTYLFFILLENIQEDITVIVI